MLEENDVDRQERSVPKLLEESYRRQLLHPHELTMLKSVHCVAMVTEQALKARSDGLK